MKRIDLNCDMGEMPDAIADGTQEAMMRFVSSANVACGGHAGDRETMASTIEQAVRWGVAVGAHPSYPDRENFGRVDLEMSPEALAETVAKQAGALAEMAASRGVRVTHVKPHGALYNRAAKDRVVAQVIADGVARWSRDVVLVGLAGSVMLDVFRKAGFRVAAEAFADRRYEADGSLRARRFDDSLIRNPVEAARQAVRIAERGTVIACDGSEVVVRAQTICVHGDTPGACEIAAAVNEALREAGFVLAPISR